MVTVPRLLHQETARYTSSFPCYGEGNLTLKLSLDLRFSQRPEIVLAPWHQDNSNDGGDLWQTQEGKCKKVANYGKTRRKVVLCVGNGAGWADLLAGKGYEARRTPGTETTLADTEWPPPHARRQ